jgi:hypothetical protein
MQSMPENCLGNMSAAIISQGVISHWGMKHVWTDWHFYIFVQQPHTPVQPNIMEDHPQIPHPVKKTFMSWSLQTHIIPQSP